MLLGPLAHWFDSNCTVTRFTRQKEKEGNGQAKKEIRYTISRAATPRFCPAILNPSFFAGIMKSLKGKSIGDEKEK